MKSILLKVINKILRREKTVEFYRNIGVKIRRKL